MKRLILPAILLAGCSSWHGIGTVVQKDYEPSWVQTTQQCYPAGKSTVCVPQTTVWPESWELKIRDSQGDTHSVSVSQHQYDEVKIGDAFANG